LIIESALKEMSPYRSSWQHRFILEMVGQHAGLQDWMPDAQNIIDCDGNSSEVSPFRKWIGNFVLDEKAALLSLYILQLMVAFLYLIRHMTSFLSNNGMHSIRPMEPSFKKLNAKNPRESVIPPLFTVSWLDSFVHATFLLLQNINQL
jgi:hypothetical protein